MAEVVIVGAGPVGLWLASELHLQGISVSVVEKKREPDDRSRAVSVQPNTLDLFALRGMAADVIASGTPMARGHFGALPTLLDLSVIRSPHPYALAIPQWRTEELLAERVRSQGIELRRGHELVSLVQDAEGVELVVRAGGKHQVERASYVVGCDGTRSVVRTMSGIGFPGTSNTFTAWLADAELDDPPEQPVTFVSDERGTAMLVQIGEREYRISGITIASRHLPLDTEVTESEIRRELHAAFGSDFGLCTPRWVSRFGNATRQASTYRSGRVLLAGDAAHQFFPAGGQGASLGLQDAMNLGWKLAATIQGWGPAGLLDSYDAERRVAGKAVMDNTVAQVELTSTSTPGQLELRKVFAEALAQPETNELWARRLGGFDEPIVAWDTLADHPLAGSRASEVTLTTGFTQPLLAQGRFLLLDLTRDGFDLEKAAADQVDRVDHHHARFVDGPEGWSGVTAALLRPDGRVAWATDQTGSERARAEVRGALQHWFAHRPAAR